MRLASWSHVSLSAARAVGEDRNGLHRNGAGNTAHHGLRAAGRAGDAARAGRDPAPGRSLPGLCRTAHGERRFARTDRADARRLAAAPPRGATTGSLLLAPSAAA